MTLERGRGRHRKYLPLVFTEQGVAMLSSVLRSGKAIDANLAIMRAFLQFRAMLSGHKDLSRRLDALEKKYDAQFREVFDAIRDIVEPEGIPTKKIGFLP